MLEKYQEEVLTAYKKLKYEDGPFHNLKNPTPANLRDEALMLYEQRSEGSEILRLFCKQGPAREGIGQLDIDKFRPVSHFLIDKTNRPNSRVVELVAWLIDFEPRPFDTWEQKLKDGNTKKKSGQGGGGTQTFPPTSFLERLIQWLERGPNSNKKKFTLALIPVILAAVGAYTFFEYISTQCMYWTGDQYQSVGCSVKVDHATVIALDKQKLVGLKKINRLDTITEKDLGKVWYVKIKQDSAEFYTDSGTYPLDTKKRLMPMTPYILNKYILHK